MFRTPLCLLVLVGLSTSACFAAHARPAIVRRVSRANTYDREITTFDPSGRLLQVEYSLKAAEHGSPVVGILHEGTSIVVIGKNSASSNDNDESTNKRTTSGLPGTSLTKVHRIDEHVYLFTSGLAGDAIFLASVLRNFCQKHRIQFGEAPTVAQVARHAAQSQHQLTRTGGARPLGCSALVTGVDSAEQEAPVSTGSAFDGPVSLFSVHPGGVMEDVIYSAIGQNTGSHMNLLRDQVIPVSQAKHGPEHSDEALGAALGKLMKAVGGSNGDCEVWLFRRDIGKRGETSATCFCNASPLSAKDIISAFNDATCA